MFTLFLTYLSHEPATLCINQLTWMFSGNALEKAGGREFLDGVKELRKAQAPLEVASGRHLMPEQPFLGLFPSRNWNIWTLTLLLYYE